MPFKSNKQRAWMFSNKPAMAKKFQADSAEEFNEPDALAPKKKKKKLKDLLS